MKRLSMMVLWIVIGWAMVAGCVAPTVDDPAAVEEPLRTPLDSGSGACASGNHVCFIGDAQGSCLADGSCCLGCVDARGNCQAGTSLGVCGNGGGACADCDDGLECTNDTCAPNVNGGHCYHVAKTNDSLCDGGAGHCDPVTSVCCDGVFVLTSPSSYVCAPACPPCTCLNRTDDVCYPALAPFCTCP